MGEPEHKPRVHIYSLSRLVNAPASRWEKLISSIEEGKQRAFAYYLPMREAVVLFCAKGGEDFDKILGDLIRRATDMGGVRGAKMAQDNERLFRAFVENFYPKIERFDRDCLREGQEGVEFEGVRLLGSPHFIAIDKKGKIRFAFLLAADWDEHDLKSYLSLLSVIVEKQYGAKADQIWCMDLRSGRSVKFSRSSRVMTRCSDAGRHYGRLMSVMSSE